MPLTDELLRLLRCPETKQALAPADEATLAKIRDSSAASIDAALIRDDGRSAYPIRNGFPILLIEESIDLQNQFSSQIG